MLLSRNAACMFRIFLFLLVAATKAYGASTPEKLRDWTLEDSISTRYYATSQTYPDFWAAPIRLPNGDPATVPSGNVGLDVRTASTAALVYSPDKRFFFVVSHYGVLSRDSNVYELKVFQVETIRRALKANSKSPVKPVAVATFESFSSVRPGILDARWQPDGRAVFLKGMTETGVLQVHRLDLVSGSLRRLTSSDEPFRSFWARESGVVYTVHTRGDELRESRYPMFGVRRVEGWPSADPGLLPDHVASFASYDQSPPWDIGEPIENAWLAPGGRLAVALAGIGRDRRFLLLDLMTRKARVLGHLSNSMLVTRAAAATRDGLAEPGALWTTDAKHIVLIGAAEPGGSNASILAYAVETGQSQIVEPMVVDVPGDNVKSRIVHSVELLEDGNGFRITYQQQLRKTYRFSRGKWEGSESQNLVTIAESETPKHSGPKGVHIFIRESANDPPSIVAEGSKRELVVVPPDKWLREVGRARYQTFEWRQSDGALIRGQLLLPRKQTSAGPPPLIIQNSAYVSPDLFRPDGAVPTGFAAQFFAAQGFAVLYLPHVAVPMESVKTEGPTIVERVDSAIEALEARGLIDGERVGIIGHSRTGYQVIYTITHPGRRRIAASVALDSFTSSYLSYLEDGARNFHSTEQEAMPGGSFWARKQEWLRYEPTFNVDRVVTPLLLFFHGGDAGVSVDRAIASGFYDFIGSFNLNRKPMDFFVLPEAGHIPLRPMELRAQLQLVADWMMFWLRGISPSDPDLSKRWEPLRAQQAAVMRSAAEPKAQRIEH